MAALVGMFTQELNGVCDCGDHNMDILAKKPSFLRAASVILRWPSFHATGTGSLPE